MKKTPATVLFCLALLALVFLINVPSVGGALAEKADPPVAADPQPQDDLSTDDDSARPEWADPNQSDPIGGVDEDPTPFDPGSRPSEFNKE